MTANRTGTRVLDWLKRFFSQRHLPMIFAIGAMLVMLPALKTGLMTDDLVQRAVELRPDQLPARLPETGMPQNPGSLRTVLNDLFPGINRMAEAKRYGVLPWWAPNDLKLGLWRPFAAFTHWLDYRLFPNSPVLMHAENIAWFAAVVFLVTVIYRKLMGPGLASGLAGLLFLLDVFMYFPVMFVANRGFVMSLFLGLLCFYEHLQWRSTKSRCALALSVLALVLSLLSDEAGASTFAFILAYALVLEQGSFRRRVLTMLPAVSVIAFWHLIYTLAGFGVFRVGAYIDPANEPIQFARVVIPRALVLLGSQLTLLPSELLTAVKPGLWPLACTLYAVPMVAVLLIFWPWMRRNKIAAFWCVVMLLAAIPAATVVPLTKNLGFVAVGAYGLMASFIAALVARSGGLLGGPAYRTSAWTVSILLLLLHGPAAIADRAFTAEIIASGSNGLKHFINLGDAPGTGDKNVVVVNAPCALALAYAPFYKAYDHEPLPRTLRTLVPGCTSFVVRRTDDRTLVIQARAPDIFACSDVGLFGVEYVFSYCNTAIGGIACRKGERYNLGNLTVKVLDSNAAGVATRVAFRFTKPLESPDYYWLWWDWRTWSYKPFTPPTVGQSVTLSGPR